MKVEETIGAPAVIKLNVKVDENDIIGGATKILEKIRPTWDTERINFKLLTDGITNKLVGCNLQDGKEDDTVLIRVYGNKTDLLIDRKAETRNIILLNKLGLAPDLYATFTNGLAYRFVPGCTLSTKTVRKPEIYKLVAVHMAKLHKVVVPNVKNPTPCLWVKMQNFLDLVPETFTDVNVQKRYEQLKLPSKTKLQQEKECLELKLGQLSSEAVFAHNDLLLGNVIYTKEKNQVTFIDFEYASFNYQAFDIGNHFAEFAGVENPDYTKYPDKLIQRDWLTMYLTEFNGRLPTEEEIEKLYVQVNQFSLAAHFFWGIWSLIQAEHSYIDFDFVKYGRDRLDQYFATKFDYFSLELPKYSSQL